MNNKITILKKPFIIYYEKILCPCEKVIIKFKSTTKMYHMEMLYKNYGEIIYENTMKRYYKNYYEDYFEF